MKIQKKILFLMLITFGLLLMASIVFKKIHQKQELLFLKSLDKSHEITADNYFAFKKERYDQIVRDYSEWDDMVNLIYKHDSAWARGNIDRTLEIYKISFAAVYGIDKKNVYKSLDTNELSAEQFQLVDSYLKNNDIKTDSLHFYLKLSSGIVEITGSNVYHTDELHGNKYSHGYFIIGKLWTKDYLQTLGKNIDLKVAVDTVFSIQITDLHDDNYCYIKPLNNLQGKAQAQLLFTDHDNFPEEIDYYFNLLIIISLSLATIATLVLFFATRNWITKPLELILKAVNNNHPVLLNKLCLRNTEFGTISRIIQEFFAQTELLITQIQEQQRTEMALKESEENNRILLDILPDIVFVHRHGKVLYANQEAVSFLNFDHSDIQNRNVLEFVDTPYIEMVTDKIKRRMDGEKLSEYEIDVVSKTGEKRSVIVKATTLYQKGELSSIVVFSDITQRKQYEIELKESEEKYKSLLDLLPDSVIVHKNTKIVYSNKATSYHTEYSQEELSGLSILDVLDERSKEKVIQNFTKRTNNEDVPDYEIDIVSKSGEIKSVIVRATIIQYQKEQAILAVLIDITERKKTEAALVEAEQRYRNLFNNSLIGIYRTSPSDEIIMANPTFINMLGFNSLADLKTSYDSVLTKNSKYIREFSEKIQQSGEIIGLETEWIKDDESTIFIRENSKAYKDEDGKLLYYEGTFEDITELKKSQIAIEEFGKKFKTLFDLSTDAIFLFNHNQIKECNHTARKMFGYTKEEFFKMKPEDFSASFQENGRESSAYAKELIKETFETGRNIFEWIFKRSDGTEFYADMRMISFKLGQQNVIQAIVRDISERKIAEQKLNDMYAALVEQKEQIESQAELLAASNKELEKLSIVASKTENSVVIARADGELEWVNEGFTQLLGITLDEFKNRYGSNFYGASLNSSIKEVVAACIKYKRSASYSTRTLTKKGREIWLQTSLTPIFDQSGTFVRIIAIDTEVTKLKMAEQEILQQKEEILAQKDEIEKNNKHLIHANYIIETKNRNITDSIKYAKRIQQAIVPPKELFDKLLPDSFIFFRPKDIVSGDFYWLAQKENFVLIAAVDCTGHGVPGAFMSIIANNLLNQALTEYYLTDPSLILDLLNVKLQKTLHSDNDGTSIRDGMDLSLCVINTKTNKLQFAGAYNPLMIVRNKEITLFRGDRFPIGMNFNESFRGYKKKTFVLEKGDVFYLYSDGFADQIGGEFVRKFMSKNFRDVLVEISEQPMPKQNETLKNIFEQWKGNNEQMDDVLVIGIRYQCDNAKIQ